MTHKVPTNVMKIACENADSPYWNKDGYEFEYLILSDWIIINRKVDNGQRERIICKKWQTISVIV
jgi:hypothetical protein